ncbi:substrate-binding domain-containing protein [Candidatus Electronema sp. PJ]|uniref:substrate-binding domain-containing protein n=1 Tax=Candidatus Electronema sp. PJ TaxID=3401572 RepID=UPI003AA860DA
MKKTGTAQLLVLVAFLTTAMSGQDSLAKETILRIHGSNTIGAKLAPDLAKAFLLKLGAESVKQLDLTSGTEMDIEGHFADKEQTKVIEIRAHGSSTAFKGLKEKQCDIGMSSRKIKDSEAQELAGLGDMTGSACEHVLAMDGVAVIVNSSNAAVSKLSFPQLADIFSGKLKNWSELSWGNAPINIQARDENSGTHDTFKGIILGEKKLDAAAQRWDSNEKLSDAVNTDVHAVGYCGLPYVKHNKALAISDGGPAVRPTVFTVATEDYPVSRRLYLYSPAAPANAYTQDFIEFALASDGQELVKKHKFVDLTISAEDHKIEVAPGTNQNYQVLYKYLTGVREAKRLSANFRFQGEALALDNRAVRDVERIVDFLASNRNKEILLAGFSDSAGDSSGDRKMQGLPDSQESYEKHLALSCKRAEVVKEELSSRGIKVRELFCVGSEMPVASNSTALGREKNRRVEVWLK